MTEFNQTKEQVKKSFMEWLNRYPDSETFDTCDYMQIPVFKIAAKEVRP